MRPHRSMRSAASLTALLCLVAAWLPGAIAAVPMRTSFDMQVPLAPTPLKIAGVPQLVYELHLTNFADDALTLKHVQVLDAAGATLIDLRGQELDHRLGRPGLTTGQKDKREIAPGMRAVLYIEVPVRDRAMPRELRHRIEYASASTGEATEVDAVVEGARIAVLETPPPSLSPPLRGGPWAAIHDPAWPRGHRRVFYAVDGRAFLPGRYAIDWVKLDDQGREERSRNGGSDQVTDWYGYGEDVLAVADGVIASTRDDVVESATISAHPKHSITDASGNYVALDIGNGRYAFYEHLKPGSLRVRPGQRVRRGDVIASLGFTGDSTGPHLHFHVADADSPLGAEGVPYVFDGFEILGRYEAIGDLGKKRWQPYPVPAEAHRSGERPAANVVLKFEAASKP